LLFAGGVRFYADGPDPNNPSTEWYAISVKHEWALITSLVILVVLFIITFIAGLYIPILYKQSKMLYFQSDEYKQNVIKYANMDLKKYSILKIKWLKKLGYIDKVRYSFYKKPTKKTKK
jgi:competence protein ComGC